MAAATGPTILIVDDDPAMLLLADRIIRAQSPGTRLHTAARAEQAMAHLHRQPVEVVLCDHRLDRANGLDVLETALHEQPQAIRILMSGFPMPALLEEARRRAKVHDLIEKPLGFEALQAILTDRVIRPYLQQAAASR